MRDPTVKLSVPATEGVARRADILDFLRARRRMLLLVVVPLIAVAAGLALYLSGGRYISTDNAYVGAQKVLITPDISGKISQVAVREGATVKAGDELFQIDPEPFRLALAQAQAKLAGVRTDFANLKTNLKSIEAQIALARQTVELKQRDLDRKSALLASRTGTPADVDTSTAALVAARNALAQLEQQAADQRNQLLGNPDLPVEQYPAFIQAQAVLDQAARDLDHTTLRAPIDGIATQVDNIQLGRFVNAGTPVFSVIDTGAPWVDANPKETDITWLRPGQKVTIDVDTFPDHPFKGTVAAVSPGTGAQFAILPPQNANGNWVKVVQRVPVRIVFDKGQELSNLRAGMSANVSIDTGRSRSLAGLIGLSSSHAQERTP